MREYLLDTTVLMAYIRGRAGARALVHRWVVQHEAATSMLVYGEIIERIQGWFNYTEKRGELRHILHYHIPALRITYAILERYAELRRALRSPGGGPGSFMLSDVDALIAATAMEHAVTLVTADGDFGRVQGLSLLTVPVASLR